MRCVHPMPAYRLESGQVVFAERGAVGAALTLPCGQCINCRLNRSQEWAIRCVHEASLHSQNSFITLTYNNDNLPANGSLHYRDVQLFLKRFRKRHPKIKISYYLAGEYGAKFSRPHYHACFFGYAFPDRVPFFKSKSGCIVYRSSELDNLWGLGFTSVGDMTLQSAGYVARYCLKKITGRDAPDHYKRVNFDTGEIYSIEPEFARMSLKPGIGNGWREKYQHDVYAIDAVVVNNRKIKPPRYYDKKYSFDYPIEFDLIKSARELSFFSQLQDNSDARLAVIEEHSILRSTKLIRGYDNDQ